MRFRLVVICGICACLGTLVAGPALGQVGPPIDFAEDWDTYANVAEQEAVWPVACDSGWGFPVGANYPHVWVEPNSVNAKKSYAQGNMRDLTPEILAADPNGGIVNGTDASPLVLTIYFDLNSLGKEGTIDAWVELNDGVDRAESFADPDGTAIHNALGVGFFPEWFYAGQGGYFAITRCVFYDGQSWYEAGGIAPGFGDDVTQGKRWNFVTLTIWQDFMDVELYQQSGDKQTYSRFDIPRQYTGGFKRIGLGPCRVPTFGSASQGWIDNIYLQGGEVTAAPSTCNTPPQDVDGNGHVDLTDYGTFLTCYNGPNKPYGGVGVPGLEEQCACLDSDDDADVDLTDYGAFLGCYNGPANPPGC
jgi:hypothetical protein